MVGGVWGWGAGWGGEEGEDYIIVMQSGTEKAAGTEADGGKVRWVSHKLMCRI